MVGERSGQVGPFPRKNYPGYSRKVPFTGAAAVPPFGWKDFGGPPPFNTKRLFHEVKAIADTGFLVAFGNRNDFYHAWAVELAKQVTEPMLTCEAVLAETAFHLGDAALVLEFIRAGLVQPVFTLVDHASRLTELAERYRDRQPGLADLCLIRMSELHPKHSVVTTDLADFRVYKRNRRETIPLIHP